MTVAVGGSGEHFLVFSVDHFKPSRSVIIVVAATIMMTAYRSRWHTAAHFSADIPTPATIISLLFPGDALLRHKLTFYYRKKIY
jgi:hypothetical protein